MDRGQEGAAKFSAVLARRVVRIPTLATGAKFHCISYVTGAHFRLQFDGWRNPLTYFQVMTLRNSRIAEYSC